MNRSLGMATGNASWATHPVVPMHQFTATTFSLFVPYDVLSRAAFWRRLERIVRAQLLVKEFRCEIGPVWPDDGFKLFVE